MLYLNDFGLGSLYKKFHQEQITKEVVWNLEDADLLNMGINIGGRLQFERARKRHKEKKEEDAKLKTKGNIS